MTFSEAQENNFDRTRKEANKGYSERVVPPIDESKEKIIATTTKLYATHFEDVEPNLGDLKRKRTTYNGQRMTVEDAYIARMHDDFYAGKNSANRSMVQIASGSYTNTAARLNYLMTLVLDEEIQLPSFKQYVTARDDLKSGEVISRRLLNNNSKEWQNIKQNVLNGIARGLSVQDMAELIEDRFQKTSIANALRVVRTESNRMMNAGAYDQMLQASKILDREMKKRYIASLDDRTRPQSAEMDGQEVGIDEPFRYPNGATAMYPGNSGVAKYDINDRCTSITIIEGIDPETRTVRNLDTGRSETISYRGFDQWAKESGITRNRYGEVIVK